MTTSPLVVQRWNEDLADQPVAARYKESKVHASMASALEIVLPVKGSPRLEEQRPEQLDYIELSSLGLHWPDLDEDLSIRGLLAGDHGQQPHRAA